MMHLASRPRVAPTRGRSHSASSTAAAAAAHAVRHRRSGSSHFQQQQQHLVNARGRVVAHATLDDPELAELVRQLIAQTPAPPASRPKLEAAIKAIDEANAGDPKTVPGDDGRPAPFRLAYSQWLTDWVKKLDPDACDELLILARGKSIESWKLSAIRRDDFAPNAGGQKMWEFERKRWVADRLLSVMEGAGYDKEGPEAKLVEDVMMGRNIPNPRDMRPHDLVGPFGLVNLKLLAASRTVQTLADAEALLFLDRSFADLFDQMPANEVEPLLRKELSRLSQPAVVAAMKMKRWAPAQEKLLARALPKPFRFNDILRDAEGVAASSTHPGDWRFRDFDYD